MYGHTEWLMDRHTDNQIERHKISDRQADGYRKIERTSQLKPINIFQPNSLSLLLLLLLFSSSSFTSSSSPFYFTKGELKKNPWFFSRIFLARNQWNSFEWTHDWESIRNNNQRVMENSRAWKIRENIHEGREKVEYSSWEWLATDRQHWGQMTGFS